MVTHNPELAQQAHRQVHIVDGKIDQIHEFNTLKAVPGVGRGTEAASAGASV